MSGEAHPGGVGRFLLSQSRIPRSGLGRVESNRKPIEPGGIVMRSSVAFILGLTVSIGFAGASLAAEKTVTGTLADSFCYITMGAHGAGHKKCATECAKKGIPVALVEK